MEVDRNKELAALMDMALQALREGRKLQYYAISWVIEQISEKPEEEIRAEQRKIFAEASKEGISNVDIMKEISDSIDAGSDDDITWN